MTTSMVFRLCIFYCILWFWKYWRRSISLWWNKIG
jgi:hypothetical protein